MKLRELPDDTNVLDVKLKVPEKELAAYREYCGTEVNDEVYVVGTLMGDFFISNEPRTRDGQGKRQIFPMPESIQPEDLLDWEVAE
jgi:hypothetical protein